MEDLVGIVLVIGIICAVIAGIVAGNQLLMKVIMTLLGSVATLKTMNNVLLL